MTTATQTQRPPLPSQSDDEFVASAGPVYAPAPEGPHAAVCCDLINLGLQKSEWQGKVREKHKIRILWQIDALDEQGKRFIVGRTFTKSLHENSGLRAFLESWRGRAFTEAELAGFNLTNLLGISCFIQIKHNTKQGKTYANVDTIMRLPKSETPLTVTPDYVRVKDRKKDEQTANENDFPPPLQDDEDDLPF